MQTVIKNRYKQRGLFVCHHPVHSRFNFEVSPYHVLKQKQCYGCGCVQFLWKCKIYGKSFVCPRGFKHVGRNCFSCKHYYEEKICRSPETSLDSESMTAYMRELEDYRYWLSTVIDRKVKFSGKIESVFPSLTKTIDNHKSHIQLQGFLISFAKAHIGFDLFDSTIYLHVGHRFIEKWQPAPDDSIDCSAELKFDRGRIVMINPTHVEIDQGDQLPYLNYSKALVGKSTGSIVVDNISACRGCPFGALLDIEVIRPKPNQYRRFYCLRGVSHSQNCPIRLEWELSEHENQPAEI
jgi:hypothetical protein